MINIEYLYDFLINKIGFKSSDIIKSTLDSIKYKKLLKTSFIAISEPINTKKNKPFPTQDIIKKVLKI